MYSISQFQYYHFPNRKWQEKKILLRAWKNMGSMSSPNIHQTSGFRKIGQFKSTTANFSNQFLALHGMMVQARNSYRLPTILPELPTVECSFDQLHTVRN